MIEKMKWLGLAFLSAGGILCLRPYGFETWMRITPFVAGSILILTSKVLGIINDRDK